MTDHEVYHIIFMEGEDLVYIMTFYTPEEAQKWLDEKIVFGFNEETNEWDNGVYTAFVAEGTRLYYTAEEAPSREAFDKLCEDF